ncbi:MAG: tRNA (adenosine(37)-N6)-threonylcarbamoyltransferase complex ATPase subunit type 1 TsaE [Candidatus Moranbacteria bacterium]|nr:tRNA (adenosine(37)-N6)-threonylcarbamoyltransferase complex ATPase subunit type 1 TsaE [Candidatus Moranbacteria bacterium]
MKNFTTFSHKETQNLARLFAETIHTKTLLCLSGDLGSGKTTFTQGMLEFFGAEPPYTSPTFSLIKEYPLPEIKNGISSLYHIDTYRITSSDILSLGWEELLQKPQTLILLEWPENVSEYIPKTALFLSFSHPQNPHDKDTRFITLPNNLPKDIASTTNDSPLHHSL